MSVSPRAPVSEGHLSVQRLDTDIFVAGSFPHYSDKSLLGSMELVLAQGQTHKPQDCPNVMVARDWPCKQSN